MVANETLYLIDSDTSLRFEKLRVFTLRNGFFTYALTIKDIIEAATTSSIISIVSQKLDIPQTSLKLYDANRKVMNEKSCILLYDITENCKIHVRFLLRVRVQLLGNKDWWVLVWHDSTIRMVKEELNMMEILLSHNSKLLKDDDTLEALGFDEYHAEEFNNGGGLLEETEIKVLIKESTGTMTGLKESQRLPLSEVKKIIK